MTDRTSGPGGDRRRPERLSRGDEWTPEQESGEREERAPGDAAPGRRVPRTPRPEERLPGEPGAREGGGGREPGAGPGEGGRLSGGGAGGRFRDADVGGPTPGERGSGRLPGSAGPGREGLTGDDRTPQDTPHPPPGPAGVTESALSESGVSESGTSESGISGNTGPAPGPAGSPASGTSEDTASRRGPAASPAPGRPHGSEGLRPGTEDLGAGTPGTEGRGARTYGGRDSRTAGGDAGGPEWAGEEEGMMPDDGLGAPAVAGASWREARTTEGRDADAWPAPPGGPAASGAGGQTTTAPSGAGAPLLAHEETDRWEQRLREVTAGFVDQPREAVEEADRTLEEIARRFTEAVTRRRRTLRMSWEGGEARGTAAGTDTEQLRLALRDYRELAGRLLHG
ncbi:hypothetical protein [Streptomyces cinerochromogenes]|uniref:hypothetical protein n=1 Tax=Streptomyces cinerochromogenes TaxID=66422 RepID=UPI0019A917E6|nr:hypothetical protein [Streptomyces cinerochromogenes]GGS43647.1 hypothetical protein GCM10010206_01140 [Streptomyces cinerochromogenes]